MDVEIFSFFSGLGFLDLGFENAGFNIVFVNEHDSRFLSAYQYARRNGGHTPAYGYSEKDVREYLSDELWKKTFPDYDNREEKLIGFIRWVLARIFLQQEKIEEKMGRMGN